MAKGTRLQSRTPKSRAKPKRRVPVDLVDGTPVTVIMLVTVLDFLPPGARPPAGPLLRGKMPIKAIAVGGHAVASRLKSPAEPPEPKILGILTTEEEGRTWARGWEGDAVNAMRTVNAIQDLPP